MLIQILGWACTIIIVLGYYLNAKRYHLLAMSVWITGDIGWIIYDYQIDNWSHATLSTIIIALNVYGRYNLNKRKMSKSTINKLSKDLFS